MNSEWDLSVIHQISDAVTMANRLLSGPAENPEAKKDDFYRAKILFYEAEILVAKRRHRQAGA
jgi:hypothetical protein